MYIGLRCAVFGTHRRFMIDPSQRARWQEPRNKVQGSESSPEQTLLFLACTWLSAEPIPIALRSSLWSPGLSSLPIVRSAYCQADGVAGRLENRQVRRLKRTVSRMTGDESGRFGPIRWLIHGGITVRIGIGSSDDRHRLIHRLPCGMVRRSIPRSNHRGVVRWTV